MFHTLFLLKFLQVLNYNLIMSFIGEDSGVLVSVTHIRMLYYIQNN